MFSCDWTHRSLRVRPANRKDHAAVERLVRALHLGDRVLVDLQTFCTAARTQARRSHRLLHTTRDP